MKSYSQCGQDLFAWHMLGKIDDGTFLDVGANHPIEKSNSYGLEEIGWKGVLIENDPNCIPLLQLQRTSPVVKADATKFDFSSLKASFLDVFDYLSLDTDLASFPSLIGVMNHFSPRVITVEHDRYRFGPEPKIRMRQLLKNKGYDLVCADVKDQGMEFEDWWVAPELSDRADYVRCVGEEGNAIASRL